MRPVGRPREEASRHSEARLAHVDGALIATKQVRTSSMQALRRRSLDAPQAHRDLSCLPTVEHELGEAGTKVLLADRGGGRAARVVLTPLCFGFAALYEAQGHACGGFGVG